MGEVTSSKISALPFTGYDGKTLSVVVQTANQSIKSQPVLWIVHGSGGVSSCDELWADAALKRGYTIVWIDHYSPRNIYKFHHKQDEEILLYHYHLAIDIHNAIDKLVSMQHIIPFADLDNIKMVGFSSGGSAVMYTVIPEFDHTRIKHVAALYPGIWPMTSKVITADGSKISIYVGDDDDWTRKSHCEIYCSIVPNVKLTSYPNTKHSFSKPGSGGYYPEIHNISLVPFDVPTPMEETLNFNGRYREIYEAWEGKYIGASAEYNHDSTMHAINDFLGSELIGE